MGALEELLGGAEFGRHRVELEDEERVDEGPIGLGFAGRGQRVSVVVYLQVDETSARRHSQAGRTGRCPSSSTAS